MMCQSLGGYTMMRKRFMVLALAGVMAVLPLAGCSKTLEDNEVVATVDGDEISAGLANFYARMNQAQYETWYAGYMRNPSRTRLWRICRICIFWRTI